MITLDELKFNIGQVNENIFSACQKAGRGIDSLKVVAATKTQPIERIKELIELSNITVAGENRVQEFTEKYSPEIDWHFIGRLQTNKVKNIVGKVSLIHSVDRENLLSEIDRISKNRNLVSDILVEVNIAGEEAKGGLSAEEVEGFIFMAEKYKNIKIKGIMSVMPNEKNITKLARYYLLLSKLYDKILSIRTSNAEICYFSAGMSEDYQIAIEYGANMLRLGRALFGARE